MRTKLFTTTTDVKKTDYEFQKDWIGVLSVKVAGKDIEWEAVEVKKKYYIRLKKSPEKEEEMKAQVVLKDY